MESQILALSHHPNKDYSSNVDTSRPFRSVKEAVAIFGERFLVGDIYSPKPFSFNTTIPENEIITPWNYQTSPHDDDENPNSYDIRGQSADQDEMLETLRRLEAELEATKMELMLLKKRESETEIALATLNAELHKNASKLADSEEAAASDKVETAEADVSRTRTNFESGSREEERRKRCRVRKENSSTLGQILNVKENDCFGGRKEIRTKNMMKKKPIVPLVTDLFKKRGWSSPSTVLHSTLYQSPNTYFN